VSSRRPAWGPLRKAPESAAFWVALGACALLGCAAGGAKGREPALGGGAEAAQALPQRLMDERDWRDEVIYFVMTDRFFNGDPRNDRDVALGDKGAFHGGDFAGLTAKLDYLAELGITALWITPIVEQIDHPVHGAGFADWGYHGYWAENFEAVEPRLGSLRELQELVRQAHARKIKVLIDVVINHPGYGSHFAKEARWVRSEELGTCDETADDVKKCLSGLPDFRTEDPQVASQLIDWQVAWIERTGCDGFRVDTVKHVEHEVWREFRRRILARHPGFFLLGEVWGATQHEDYASEYLGDQMDSLVDFGFHGAAEGFVQGRGRPGAYAHFLSQRHGYPQRMVLAHYLDSHDETSMLFRLEGDRAKMTLVAALQMTSLGIPIVTWGNEVGRRGGEWPESRSDMLWGEAQDSQLHGTYRKLIALRRRHRSLSRGGLQRLHAGQDTLALLRSLPGDEDPVITAYNRGAQPATIELTLSPGLSARARWTDALGGATFAVAEGKLSLALPPMTALLLEPEPKP